MVNSKTSVVFHILSLEVLIYKHSEDDNPRCGCISAPTVLVLDQMLGHPYCVRIWKVRHYNYI